jgi:hypothetical protein
MTGKTAHRNVIHVPHRDDAMTVGVAARRRGLREAVMPFCFCGRQRATRDRRRRKPLGIGWYFSCDSPKFPPPFSSLESRLARETSLRLSVVGIGSTTTDRLSTSILRSTSESTMR